MKNNWALAKVIIGILATICGAIITVAVTTMATSMMDLRKDVVEMKISMGKVQQELSDARPKDVLYAVHNLDKKTLTRKEIENIVATRAPWLLERKAWEAWKLTVERRLNRIEDGINKSKN